MMFGIVGRILFMPSKLYVALAASGGMIMQAHAQSVPKLQVGGRVMDLAHGTRNLLPKASVHFVCNNRFQGSNLTMC